MKLDDPQVTIPDDAWKDEDGNGHRLLAQIRVNGIGFHVTAIAVCEGDDGVQHACDADEEWELDAIADIGRAGGAWQTLTIKGREYVVFATPHC